ncbi:LysM domain-containing protein [Prosthecobacter sp. SYSU 5D2]|uniref:LysM peptidoglycan-binding domain-containing protein n=1 Tax=Prosthecobacter sp. SYSU 5D2 TaxID=3134134 RepID=UPI0031FEAFE1
MSTKKKDKLLLNLLEGERYKHRVAMVTDEGAFNQHEPNSNMARMFVVMLLIHVVVIGGIIVYDFMNGEEAPTTALAENYDQRPASTMPAAPVGLGLDDSLSLEEYSTYEWKSGDSIPLVARKLEVSEAALIKINNLQGRQINTNDVILYPKRPVKKAVGISVAGTNGELAKSATPQDTIGAAEVPMNLAVPEEEPAFSFTATIEDQLTPVPTVGPGTVVQDSPPVAAAPAEASGMAVLVELPEGNHTARMEEAPPAPAPPAPQPLAVKEEEKPVIKAIPYTPPAAAKELPPVQKAPVKKVAEAPPAPIKKAPVKPAAPSMGTHVVQSGETMYRIATKHGISVAALQAANKNAKPESLQIGMKLAIPRK